MVLIHQAVCTIANAPPTSTTTETPANHAPLAQPPLKDHLDANASKTDTVTEIPAHHAPPGISRLLNQPFPDRPELPIANFQNAPPTITLAEVPQSPAFHAAKGSSRLKDQPVIPLANAPPTITKPEAPANRALLGSSRLKDQPVLPLANVARCVADAALTLLSFSPKKVSQ